MKKVLFLVVLVLCLVATVVVRAQVDTDIVTEDAEDIIADADAMVDDMMDEGDMLDEEMIDDSMAAPEEVIEIVVEE